MMRYWTGKDQIGRYIAVTEREAKVHSINLFFLGKTLGKLGYPEVSLLVLYPTTKRKKLRYLGKFLTGTDAGWAYHDFITKSNKGKGT